jgi:hypothetical protein
LTKPLLSARHDNPFHKGALTEEENNHDRDDDENGSRHQKVPLLGSQCGIGAQANLKRLLVRFVKVQQGTHEVAPSSHKGEDADGDEADDDEDEDDEGEEDEEGGSGAARWPPESVHAVAAARDALLAWVGGKCVHVGDVGALDVVEARPSPTHAADAGAGAGVGVPMLAVVAGEGCQVLRIE